MADVKKVVKGKSAFWPMMFIVVPVIFLLSLSVWIAVDSSYTVKQNNERITHQNFNTALVIKAQTVASFVPWDITVNYKTAEGNPVSTLVIVYSYGFQPPGEHYALYYYPKEIGKNVKINKAIIYSDKASKAGNSWIVNMVNSVASWPIWADVGASHADGSFYSP